MPSRVVKQPNGLLAVFSTVVDDFTMLHCSESEMRDHWVRQIGIVEGNAKVDRGLADDMTGICMPGQFKTRWEDAIDTVRLIHGHRTANERIKQCSSPVVEAVT